MYVLCMAHAAETNSVTRASCARHAHACADAKESHLWEKEQAGVHLAELLFV